MVRSTNAPLRAGYRSARPIISIRHIRLATHGRSIQMGHVGYVPDKRHRKLDFRSLSLFMGRALVGTPRSKNRNHCGPRQRRHRARGLLCQLVTSPRM